MIMVTTLPAGIATVSFALRIPDGSCWRESEFPVGIDWLLSLVIRVVDLDSEKCVRLMSEYIRDHPDIWNEDIGQERNTSKIPTNTEERVRHVSGSRSEECAG